MICEGCRTYITYTGKERDGETGLDYFGARYMSAAQGRFTGPDPLARSASPPLPQTWNRYSYALNNPLKYIDPDGKCSTPAGIKSGQVGICIGSFIASKRIGGIGLGDNRGPVGNDPKATFRAQTQIIVDPAKGTIVRNETKAGKSSVLVEGLGIQGTANTQTSKPSVDDKGNTHFNVTTSATNGFGGSIFPSIDLSINVIVTSDGKVGIEGGRRDGYPSLEVYSYDAKGNPTEVLTKTETKPEDLKPPMEQEIEKRKPK
jgi:RHS repeat-associated protein